VRFEKLVKERGTLSETDVRHIRDEAMQAIKSAVVAANGAPDARADDILDSVFATTDAVSEVTA
jgi:TPP-dependent pyruvate/acetoin dehydrogenase alpha subunit